MTTQTELTQKNHRRAVRFFWCFLICASVVSLVANVAHAVLPFIPHVLIQIGAAAVPPIALLAAVHGIALAVRAGASGPVYRWAVVAVSAIGIGAFSVSFLALRDLMQAIGYSHATSWIFPAIIDTTVAVSTMMLVALGDKPPRRQRAPSAISSGQKPPTQGAGTAPTQTAKPLVGPATSDAGRAQTARSEEKSVPASIHSHRESWHDPVQSEATQTDADLAAELLASRATTQPIETVIAVLDARRAGATINGAAKASGVNYRTAQRIVEAASVRQQRQPAATG